MGDSSLLGVQATAIGSRHFWKVDPSGAREPRGEPWTLQLGFRSCRGPLAQPGRVGEHDRVAFLAKPAAGGEVGQGFVDPLAERSDELGELDLGQPVRHLHSASVRLTEAGGEVEQRVGYPALHVENSEVKDSGVGAVQPAGQHVQQPGRGVRTRR